MTMPRPRRVEQRERRRLVAAGVLVGVVADDRACSRPIVDPPVDAREPGRDLVDRAVEVVDPPLQRDGELDEVLAAAADERPLRVAQAADADPGEPARATSPAAPSDDPENGDERGGGSRRGARAAQPTEARR